MSVSGTLMVVSNPYEELLSQISVCIGDRIAPHDKHTLRLIIEKFIVDFPSPNGPPVSVNRAFYFSHEHEDYPGYSPIYKETFGAGSGSSFSSTVVDDVDVPQHRNDVGSGPASDGLRQLYRSTSYSSTPSASQVREINFAPPLVHTREKKKLTRTKTAHQRSSTTQKRVHRLVALATQSLSPRPSPPSPSIEQPFVDRSVSTTEAQGQTHTSVLWNHQSLKSVRSRKYKGKASKVSDQAASGNTNPGTGEPTEEGQAHQLEHVTSINRDPPSPDLPDTQDSGIADIDGDSPLLKRGWEKMGGDFKNKGSVDEEDDRERKKCKTC